jgi:hypothetical protein
MRVETLRETTLGTWEVGLVGTYSERFRRVALSAGDLARLEALDPAPSFAGDGALLRLGLRAYALGIAHEFDPYFGLSISRVDPLPHQLEAVYDHLLKAPRIRFLLADDAGAGKTIMAGLLIRELKLRGLAERVLIVCPANLTFQWQRELHEKFDEKKFVVLKGHDVREQFGLNQWLENTQVITSLDLAKRQDILPGLRQVHWDLVIVDEAHRLSWTPPSRKTARYELGELLRETADHVLLLTAPHPTRATPPTSPSSSSSSTGTPSPTSSRSARPWSGATPPSTCAAPRRPWSTSPSGSPTAPGWPSPSSRSASPGRSPSRSTGPSGPSTRTSRAS